MNTMFKNIVPIGRSLSKHLLRLIAHDLIRFTHITSADHTTANTCIVIWTQIIMLTL